MRCYSHYMDEVTRVGVIDKSMAILNALELGPLSLADLTSAVQLPRPTTHRLALALETHGLLERDGSGRFQLGPRLGELSAARGSDRLIVVARPILADLRDRTGESAQLYQRRGSERICVAGADLSEGLRDTVPVGARLTMTAGSAAQVLQAWGDDGETLTFDSRTLANVRRRGFAHSIAEREPGVASISAPVHGPSGTVVAALSVSGPVERLRQDRARALAPEVVRSAGRLTHLLSAR